MDTIGFLATGIFVFGYTLIALEQKLGTHKSAIALVMGCVLWMLAAAYLHQQPEVLEMLIGETAVRIFDLVMFLLAAMALIEILVHYGLFDFIRNKLIALKVSDKQQFLLLMTLTFFLSALLDNISVTIAMLQISRRFFKGQNLLVAVAGIVIAANAGGAWSPLGDVTTILLWLADKFTALEVIMYTFFPAALLCMAAVFMLYRKLNDTDYLEPDTDEQHRLSLSEKAVVGVALGSFTLPLFMSLLDLPPYIGLLFGLGLTWMMVEFAKQKSRKEHRSHMTANIEKIVQSIDLSSINFIIGILLGVSALAAIGVLGYISTVTLGDAPSDALVMGVHVVIGALSGIVDNSSLVAMAIDAVPSTSPVLWSLLALTAGTGGSLLVIGSAAGVIASGTVKQLTFGKYLKIASLPALVGLLVGVATWMLQHLVLFA